jgi:hypothetical protein
MRGWEDSPCVMFSWLYQNRQDQVKIKSSPKMKNHIDQEGLVF